VVLIRKIPNKEEKEKKKDEGKKKEERSRRGCTENIKLEMVIIMTKRGIKRKLTTP
jgi:hypothetical protein